MKKILLGLLLFTIGICNIQAQTASPLKTYSWVGTINKKIPVTLNYTISKDHMVLGEIRYLNTKTKIPLKVIGKVNPKDESSITLSEFEKHGNISGIIDGKLNGHKFEGEWHSTKRDTSYHIDLTQQPVKNVKPEVFAAVNIEGEYAYHYGEKGYLGAIKIKKQKGNLYSYEIGSATSDPARNLADASATGIVIKHDQFILEINQSCKFKVIFYNGFLTITAVDQSKLSDCEFGFNATLEGAYLKVRN